jgi:hypothetical protein
MKKISIILAVFLLMQTPEALAAINGQGIFDDVQNQFKILQNHPRIVNNKNFKFIIGYRSQRAASVFLNSYGFSSNYLNLIDLKIGINTDMPHIPQYLFINKEGTVLFNYFCDESLNDLTESFLLTIEKRWFY